MEIRMAKGNKKSRSNFGAAFLEKIVRI